MGDVEIEKARQSVLTFIWTCVVVCARVWVWGVYVCFWFCQFRLWSVAEVWPQIHWPQAHSPESALQITTHFSHDHAVQTSRSHETQTERQCVFSACLSTPVSLLTQTLHLLLSFLEIAFSGWTCLCCLF